MTKGISLHIGLNAVDPAHYGGWAGELTACEFDAEDMATLAESKNFSSNTLLTKQATRNNFFSKLREIVSTLATGDIFFLSYSGHGGQLPDFHNEEQDRMDETWCLFDGEVVDDEIFLELSKIPKGVRVLVLSDSCHSGTVTKAAFYRSNNNFLISRNNFFVHDQEELPKYRAMPLSIAGRTYRDNREFYDKILQDDKLKKAENSVKASVLLISGCQDNQLSMDGAFNGLFTGTLLTVWNGGVFDKNYKEFHSKIMKNMPPDQTPNYFFVGSPHPDFENQKPFSI